MTSWAGYALGSALFAGLTAILAKIGVGEIPSNVATLIRTVVILALAAAVVSLRKEWPGAGQLSGRSVTFLVLSGVTTGLSWLCYYRALQGGPASLVTPLDKLSLVVTLVLAASILGEHLTVWQCLGAFLMTVGAVLITLNR